MTTTVVVVATTTIAAAMAIATVVEVGVVVVAILWWLSRWRIIKHLLWSTGSKKSYLNSPFAKEVVYQLEVARDQRQLTPTKNLSDDR
jgi:hypothetical protein